MSQKFDSCPICGCGVWYTMVGDHKNLFLPVCINGHTLQDICDDYHGKARSTATDAARCWNRAVRKYSKGQNESL